MIDRLCTRVYRGLREGYLVSDDVVKLACELLDLGHGGQAVREAVERAPEQVSPEELAESAAQILNEAGFDAGFELAPEQLVVLRRALRIVARDLPTAGTDGELELLVVDDCGRAAPRVRLADGRMLVGGIELGAADNAGLPEAVAAVANHVQSGLSESSWRVWPLCPDHDLGVHSVERSGVAVWWCSGDGGHQVAPVGALRQAGEAS